jgi:hypothetical protein
MVNIPLYRYIFHIKRIFLKKNNHGGHGSLGRFLRRITTECTEFHGGSKKINHGVHGVSRRFREVLRRKTTEGTEVHGGEEESLSDFLCK